MEWFIIVMIVVGLSIWGVVTSTLKQFKDRNTQKEEEKEEEDKYACFRCEICESLNCQEKEKIENEYHPLDCEYCGANVRTGKFDDDFMYVWGYNISVLQEKVNLLMKYGYKVVGKVFVGGYGYSNYMQGMIRKPKCKCKRKK